MSHLTPSFGPLDNQLNIRLTFGYFGCQCALLSAFKYLAVVMIWKRLLLYLLLLGFHNRQNRWFLIQGCGNACKIDSISKLANETPDLSQPPEKQKKKKILEIHVQISENWPIREKEVTCPSLPVEPGTWVKFSHI